MVRKFGENEVADYKGSRILQNNFLHKKNWKQHQKRLFTLPKTEGGHDVGQSTNINFSSNEVDLLAG